MEIKHRIENVTSVEQLPLILKLNKNAEPLEWFTYEECAIQYAKNNILWSLGSHEILLRGGTNAKTGERSKLILDTIVAVNNDKSPFSYKKNSAPALTNRSLHERDLGLCAYCLNYVPIKAATRDHILPVSKGGQDVWSNVVLSCKNCNSKKDNNLLGDIPDMKLAYVPYVPSYYESLILCNRKILTDQKEFLLKKVNKNSRLHIN